MDKFEPFDLKITKLAGTQWQRENMARKLTPERQALALEAKNLREFGYTQQEIADAFGKPRRTIAYWISIVANGTSGKVATRNHLARIPLTTMATIDITLLCYFRRRWPLQILPRD